MLPIAAGQRLRPTSGTPHGKCAASIGSRKPHRRGSPSGQAALSDMLSTVQLDLRWDGIGRPVRLIRWSRPCVDRQRRAGLVAGGRLRVLCFYPRVEVAVPRRRNPRPATTWADWLMSCTSACQPGRDDHAHVQRQVRARGMAYRAPTRDVRDDAGLALGSRRCPRWCRHDRVDDALCAEGDADVDREVLRAAPLRQRASQAPGFTVAEAAQVRSFVAHVYPFVGAQPSPTGCRSTGSGRSGQWSEPIGPK